MRQPGENLQRAGKVELRQIRENDKAETEICHGVAPCARIPAGIGAATRSVY
jgi:hypothetical protein